MFLQPTNFLPSGYLRGGPHNHVHLGTGVPMSRDLGSSTKIAVSVPLAATVYIQWRFQSCQATRTARAVYGWRTENPVPPSIRRALDWSVVLTDLPHRPARQ